MAYSQALVLAGGIAHVPILITALKFADNKTLKLNNVSKYLKYRLNWPEKVQIKIWP